MVNFVSFTVLYTLICQVSLLRSQPQEYVSDGSEPDYTTDLVDGELESKHSRHKELYFLVLLHFLGKYRCLASLISDRLILTASDCVKDGDLLQDPVLFSGHAAGAEKRIIPQPPIQFESIHVLPEGDLAILVTREIVEFGDGVGRVCLSSDTTTELMYQDAMAATFGTERPNKDTLKFSRVKVVNNSRCSIQEMSKICVDGENTALCERDFGGPSIVANKNDEDTNVQIGFLLHAATRDGRTHNGKECSNLMIYDRVRDYSKFISEVAKRSYSEVCFVTS